MIGIGAAAVFMLITTGSLDSMENENFYASQPIVLLIVGLFAVFACITWVVDRLNGEPFDISQI